MGKRMCGKKKIHVRQEKNTCAAKDGKFVENF